LTAVAGMGGKGYLLVRRAGALWGVENEAVESLTRNGNGNGKGSFLLGVGAGELCVDEIVGVVAELTVLPPTAALCRFWPEASGGLAVHAEVPLVVVDPRRPPRALRGQCSGNGRDGRDGEGVGQDG
jgi:hypothetical protein